MLQGVGASGAGSIVSDLGRDARRIAGGGFRFAVTSLRACQPLLALRNALLSAAVMLAVGAASAPSHADDDAPAAAAVASAVEALEKGDLDAAHEAANGVLHQNPREGRLQYLNGLAYHLAAEKGDASAADLARVGYETSLRFNPNDFWSNYMLGALEFERGNWKEAQEHFSDAVLRRPDDWRAMAGLAGASYYAGDAGLASMAGERAAVLAPHEQQALRVAALTDAAVGDDAGADRYLAAYTEAGGDKALAARIDRLKRTAAVDASGYPSPPPAGAVPPGPASQGMPPQAAPGYPGPAAVPPSESPSPVAQPDNQMIAEVTIILSDDTAVQNRGVNLLDGLTMQFGFEDSRVEVGGTPVQSLQQTITRTITIPTITYNLNILNNQKQFYWVLGRPTLTAYVGEQSTFFVGHTLHVAVSGVNLGSLEQVDAGVSLKLLPISIAGNHVKFHIDADRSFLDPVPLPGFTQEISIFKEQASATAELDYGQTLILSGMEENVYDADKSVTPGLFNLPVIGEFFGRREVNEQRTSVLILVTPVPPVALALPRRMTRDGGAERVADLWTSLIDPQTDIAAIAERLKNWHAYTRAGIEDLQISGPGDAKLLSEALHDSEVAAAQTH